MTDFLHRAWHWLLLLWHPTPAPPEPPPDDRTHHKAPDDPEDSIDAWRAFERALEKPKPPARPLDPLPDPEPPPEPPVPPRLDTLDDHPLPEPPTQAKPFATPKPKPSDVYGQFYFREQILDQLDDYFNVAKRMRKYDPHSYALYSRIGAHVMPYKELWFGELGEDRQPNRELSAWWKTNRPAFGAVALVHPIIHTVEEQVRKTKMHRGRERPDGRVYHPRFVWFTKYKPGHAPIHVQKTVAGDVYTVGMYWQQHKDRDKFADIPQEFPILIDADNNVHVLNVHMRGMRTIDSPSRCHGRKGGQFRVPDVRWGIPKDLIEWAGEHKLEVHDHLRHLFIGAVNTFEQAQYSMVRIDVKKHSMHAVFGVDIRRTPYFFRDRELTVNVKGHRKRIFHIVRGHTNQGHFVKTHFRGEREFEWQGYHVRITVPGRDHIMLPEFDIGGIDAEKAPELIGQSELGRMLQEHVEGAPLTKAFTRKRQP